MLEMLEVGNKKVEKKTAVKISNLENLDLTKIHGKITAGKERVTIKATLLIFISSQIFFTLFPTIISYFYQLGKTEVGYRISWFIL